MRVEVKRFDQTNHSYSDIVNLIHEAFVERKNEGLLFSCINISEDEYRAKVGSGIIFVAEDVDCGQLLGTSVAQLKKDKFGVLYGYDELLAIHPSARRLGIATAMLEARINYYVENGAEYAASDTAVGATSSVKYHLRNGYRIVGLRSFKQTNYFSYIFRRQLVVNTFKQRLYNNALFCRGIFLISSARTRIVRRSDGDYTVLAKLLLFKKRK